MCIVVASAAVGWVLGRHGLTHDDLVILPASFQRIGSEADPQAPAAALDVPASGAAAPVAAVDAAVDAVPAATPAEVGRLKAEILRLRVLFNRLADAAQLDDDGEFDLDYEIDARSGDGEPLSALDPALPQTVPLLIERIAPMLLQSERMAHIFDERRQAWSQRVSGRPLQGGAVSSGYGPRLDPLTGVRVMHRGLDFVAPVGSPILAIADGVVTWSGPNGGYGLLVELEHAEGFRTRYAHNDTTSVALGQRVEKGEPIATLGSSGRSTGPHLHLEVRQHGKALDPRFYIR